MNASTTPQAQTHPSTLSALRTLGLERAGISAVEAALQDGADALAFQGFHRDAQRAPDEARGALHFQVVGQAESPVVSRNAARSSTTTSAPASTRAAPS